MIVDLLRHGALQGGVKYRGRTDDPLTDAGRCAMDTVWHAIAHEVDVIISSPLSRCATPATAWAQHSNTPYLTDNRLLELDYGSWEGMRTEEIQQQYPSLLEQWRRDPSGMRPPGGESIESLQQRIQACWQELCATYADQRLLVVAHSGSLRMLIAHVMQAPIATTRHLSMPYACWSRIEVQHNFATLQFHARQPLYPATSNTPV